ncbi:Sorting nexin, cytoplasm-to-vacuole targeting pathway/endosomal sorting [Podochytrium sp. JEL0797]|nr:Sorting nexin, cytoplasm-to-vacuole targeting pathway/endosomal sorting [Podochytrium sp. JEL0797]
MSKHLTDSTNAGTDLGAAYNGWSLTETGPSALLAPEIEALGEAIDCTVTSQHKLLHVMQEHVTEPLQNYEKWTQAIDKTLKWRHSLHVEYEASTEGLVQNRANLMKLEASENDARRVAAAVRDEMDGRTSSLGTSTSQGHTSHFGSIVGASTSTPSPAPEADPETEEEEEDPNDPYAATRRALANFNTTKPTPSTTTPTPPKALFPPSTTTILSSFSSFITDANPETTRRATILRTKEKIRSLESERASHLAKLASANESIQTDLDRFQKDKIYDLRNMLLVLAVANRDHAGRCLNAWREAEAVVKGEDAGERGDLGKGKGIGGVAGVEHDLGGW